MPPEEIRVFESECQLRLNELSYENYFTEIKRFGFQSDLTDEHLQKIAPQINLDFQEMEEDEQSPFFHFYRNSMLTDKKRFSVKGLLRVGWLVCQHPSDSDQMDALWHLVNPGCDDAVLKSEVLAFMR